MAEKRRTGSSESAQKHPKKTTGVPKKREEGEQKERIIRHRLVKDYDAHQKAWYERFIKRGIKRGHFWIWKDNREIRNDENFAEVNDYEDPDGKVGFDIRSRNVELKWHWMTLKNPIRFHKESLGEWLLNRRENGRLNGDNIIRRHLVADYDSHWRTWYERFVKGGIKRGHFWIWKDNREIRNDENFAEVNDYEDPDGKVGFDIRSRNVELKWHWKALKNPIRFHDESLEEWLIEKAIHHGEKIIEEVA